MDTKELNTVELLQELGDATPSSLNKYTRDTLRSIASRLDLEPRKMRKAELITCILEAIAEYQETVKKADAFDKVVPEVTQDELENIEQYVKTADDDGARLGKMAEETYMSFRSLCQRLYVDGVWQPLSVEVADLANQLCARLGARTYASTTLLSYRAKVLDHMQSLLELERDQFYFEQFWVYLTGYKYSERYSKPRGQGEGCQSCFAKSLYTIWKFTHANVKKEQEKSNREQKENVYKGVDITNFLQWAQDVLQRVVDINPGKKAWKAVSVALGLVTGRRQVEIHSCGEFVYVDEYHVSFTGQAKTRLNAFAAYQEQPEYTIPTLVKAELVVAGHKWLKEVSGKHYATKEQVNDNVSRDVGKFVKEIAKQTLKFFDAQENPIEGDADKFIYHDLRELYALASYEAEGKEQYKRSQAHKWVNYVLGEDRGGAGIVSTAMRYLDEFDLVSTSLCRV